MGNVLKAKKQVTMFYNAPVIAILGSTGTGKSKLAIELAKKFNGEIISADSMQVYKGLDIITNKVTNEEQAEAVHHCIDYIDPLLRYTVVDFRQKALEIIHKIIKEKKLPIICGGTNYYIESLLWEVLVNKEDKTNNLLFEEDLRDKENVFKPPDHVSSETAELFSRVITADSFRKLPGPFLHQCLKEVDPAMADTLHPEDRRKVIRSLQVYQQHGCLHSEILKEQRSQRGGSSLGGPLRFPNSAMLWLQCDKEVLHKRLDDRVDDMIERGLLTELLDFHKNYNEKRIDSQ